MYGAKQDTEAADAVRKGGVVGKHSRCDEGEPEGQLERREERMQA